MSGVGFVGSSAVSAQGMCSANVLDECGLAWFMVSLASSLIRGSIEAPTRRRSGKVDGQHGKPAKPRFETRQTKREQIVRRHSARTQWAQVHTMEPAHAKMGRRSLGSTTDLR